jgi:quercetin dioxygenase-like cupin family protein
MPRFSFAAPFFQREVAHNGPGAVFAWRALTRGNHSQINFIDLVEIPVGAAVGMHRHTFHDEEIYVIVSGIGHATLDGQQHVVSAGDVLLNSPEGIHGLVNHGPAVLRMVVIDVSTDTRPYVEPENID